MGVDISGNLRQLCEDAGPSVVIRTVYVQVGFCSSGPLGRWLVQFPLSRARRGDLEVADNVDCEPMGECLGLGNIRKDSIFQNKELSRCQSLIMDIEGN